MQAAAAQCPDWTVHRCMQVGSAAWLRQHDALERLNMQAHQSAQCRADEYIVEALVAQDRLSHLVHELLVAEVRQHGRPHPLRKLPAQQAASMLSRPCRCRQRCCAAYWG